MRLVCISDTHNKHDALNVPGGDVLLHAGDFTTTGKLPEFTAFLKWFTAQPHQHKILVCGNHDVAAITQAGRSKLAKWAEDPSHHHLMLSGVELVELPDGRVVLPSQVTPDDVFPDPGMVVTFWGSPHCRWINARWAFPHVDEDQEGVLSALPYPPEKLKPFEEMPDYVDVVITHGPRYGVLDLLPGATDGPGKGPHIGSSGLSDAIRTTRPLLHVHGHIHERAGTYHDGWTQSVNAAICTGAYKPTNPARVVDITRGPDGDLVTAVVTGA